MSNNWGDPIATGQAHRRAGGRRRYNARRQDAARRRLEIVLKMRLVENLNQSQIARRLGVHRSTIHRDFRQYDRAIERSIALMAGRDHKAIKQPYRYGFSILTRWVEGRYTLIRVTASR